MADDDLRIAFTDVLYGVVIGNAIWRLEFGVTMTNLLMGFALVVIMDDWVGYKVALRDAEPSLRNYVNAYVLDVAILVTWYFLTIVPEDGLFWYLVVLAVFFGLGSLWGFAVLNEPVGDALRQTHAWLTAIFALLAVGAAFTRLDVRLLIVGSVIYGAVRAWHWRGELDERVSSI